MGCGSSKSQVIYHYDDSAKSIIRHRVREYLLNLPFNATNQIHNLEVLTTSDPRVLALFELAIKQQPEGCWLWGPEIYTKIQRMGQAKHWDPSIKSYGTTDQVTGLIITTLETIKVQWAREMSRENFYTINKVLIDPLLQKARS